MTSRFTRHKNHHIHYQVAGEGPDLVFLHGFLESADMWQLTAAHFTDRYRVICIDLPGHGKTQTFAVEHTMELMAEVVMAVLDDLRAPNFAVVGHSMGGYVALALAERIPERIRGLCLFHSHAHADPPDKKKDRERASRVVMRSMRVFIDEAIPYLFGPGHAKVFAREVEELIQTAYQADPLGVAACLKGMKNRPDRMHVLRQFQKPIHLILGQKDPVMPLEQLRDHFEVSPWVDTSILESVGHMGFIEARTECFSALDKWLIRTASGAPDQTGH